MSERLKIVFLTGTRADYGKLKPLMKICENDNEIENYIYATGMHLMEACGYTINEVIKDGYKNIYIPEDYKYNDKMELNLAETIVSFSNYVAKVKPDVIVVHGDRTEPLAGAIVGVMNNILTAHIEGGEVTGTADEFMRHAITKLCNLHFVANNEAKFRLIQLGEPRNNIYVIGSPDIDIMLSDNLPNIFDVKSRYNIKYDKYAILMYHPVTTDKDLMQKVSELIEAVNRSERKYIVVMPNNDQGNEVIRDAFKSLQNNSNFQFFDSIPFEDFLSLLKNADFMIGNSSAGVREACVYGTPAIDVGTRQNGRYVIGALRNIQHCEEKTDDIVQCIEAADKFRFVSLYFGNGHSAEMFMKAIKSAHGIKFQKKFVETVETSDAIANYINEVCF